MKEAIGEIIRNTIRKSGFTQEEFAKEMGMTLRNLANLFNKEHIPIDQLIRASKYLKRDFISDYTKWLYENESTLKPYASQIVPDINVASDHQEIYRKKGSMTISLSVSGAMDDIKNNITDFLEVVQKEAEERGLHLT